MKELASLSKQYLAEQSKLDDLVEAEKASKTNLQELENNTELTFDVVQKQSGKLNLIIQKSSFERKAIAARLVKLEAQLKDAVAQADCEFAESEKQARKDRRAKFEQIAQSPEWLAIRMQMQALFALHGGDYFDQFVKELICREPDSREAIAIATELDLWIPDPIEPDELIEAMRIVDHKKKPLVA